MKNLLLLLMASQLLYSVNMVPLYQTVDSKKSARMVYTLTNTSSEPIAVDFSILRVLNNNGEKEQRVATDKVEAHPSQLVIKKGESKKVRVRYTGASLPATQEVYRVIAKELDISVKDEVRETIKGKVAASIKMRYSYEGLLFVNQPNAVSQLKVDSFETSLSPEGNRALKIVVGNSGTASKVVNIAQYNFLVTVNNQEYTLDKSDLIGLRAKRVLAGQNNTLLIPNIVSLPKGTIQSVRLESKKK